MEESFFNDATVLTSDVADVFFAELFIDPNEPAQSYKTWDEETQTEVTKQIIAGAEIARVCSDNVNVTAPEIAHTGRTTTFYQYPISIQLPTTGTDKIEVVQFVIDNIDRRFVDIVRRLHYPIRVNIARGFVTAKTDSRSQGECHTHEQRLLDLALVDVTSNAQTITGQLVVDTVMWKKYPNNHETYTRLNFPALWGLRDAEMSRIPDYTEPPPPPPVEPPAPPPSFDIEGEIYKAAGGVGVFMPAGSTKIFRFAFPETKANAYSVFLASGPGCYNMSLQGGHETTGPGCNNYSVNSDKIVMATSSRAASIWTVKKGVWHYMNIKNDGAAGEMIMTWTRPFYY